MTGRLVSPIRSRCKCIGEIESVLLIGETESGNILSLLSNTPMLHDKCLLTVTGRLRLFVEYVQAARVLLIGETESGKLFESNTSRLHVCWLQKRV